MTSPALYNSYPQGASGNFQQRTFTPQVQPSGPVAFQTGFASIGSAHPTYPPFAPTATVITAVAPSHSSAGVASNSFPIGTPYVPSPVAGANYVPPIQRSASTPPVSSPYSVPKASPPEAQVPPVAISQAEAKDSPLPLSSAPRSQSPVTSPPSVTTPQPPASPPQPMPPQPAPMQEVDAQPIPAMTPEVSPAPAEAPAADIPEFEPPSAEIPPVSSIDPFPGESNSLTWTPWPLPPAANAATASSIPVAPASAPPKERGRHRHLSVATRPNSPAAQLAREQASLTTAMASAAIQPKSDDLENFANPFADEPVPAAKIQSASSQLRYRGGKTLPQMAYVNIYVGGEDKFNQTTIQQIDDALKAAMQDSSLNNVVQQYFDSHPVSTIVHPSHPLIGDVPKEVTRGDIRYYVESLLNQGFLEEFDPDTTVLNFLLPQGTVLIDDDERAGLMSAAASDSRIDSINGLGGFHGSVPVNGESIYYAASPYSEQLPDGTENGIVAFDEPWKNVVATAYHQLQEVRTNPDVEDVIRNPHDPMIVSKLGWTSDNGEELGDAALQSFVSLRESFQEIPLANGTGIVPVQFLFSNDSNDSDGPVLQPVAPAAK
ncbi:hypothetical protein SH668x_001363 [Planctomicrobium sp. SH668]|uniref:hypothetical protein n=1 Tax=Planctomicrobium sp. SH668 TaxID=3448126 RepID=UPI003F5AE1EB